ncbi:kinase-like domain-containing protein [Xylaria scruposa]|nr:kinase-like domain-containing protein [Xylaria scruposa]
MSALCTQLRSEKWSAGVDARTYPFSESIKTGVVLEAPDTDEIPPDPVESSANSDKMVSYPNGFVEARIRATQHQSQHNYSITSLDTSQVDCRVLILPEKPDQFNISGSEKVTLRPVDARAGPGGVRDVRCLAVRETVEHTKDSVGVVNKSDFPLHITPLPSAIFSTGQRNNGITIATYSTGTLGTGTWVFGNEDHSFAFQAQVFPRRHVLQVIGLSTQPRATRKRDASEQELFVQPHVEHFAVAKSVECLSRMSDGEVAYLPAPNTTGEEIKGSSFMFSRIRKVGETRSAVVFQAQHSDYAKQIIVMKAFKKDSGYDVVTRGRIWEREIKAHSGLHSDHIAKLLGGDGRIHTLYIERIDGKDLCDRSWCDYNAGKRFRGTLANAQCILYDMARALKYLRGQNILHNDIKPSNIIFNSTKAVLIDFGHATRDESSTCTGGTPWYVPPEYLRFQERKAPSDVWALGIVMLFVLRQVSLPDAGVDVPVWQLKELWSAESTANAQMEKWLEIVAGQAKKMAVRGGGLESVVSRMVLCRPRERITASELVSAVEALVLHRTEQHEPETGKAKRARGT